MDYIYAFLVSDQKGMFMGCHLLTGCQVHITVEMCILETEYTFELDFDLKPVIMKLKALNKLKFS